MGCTLHFFCWGTVAATSNFFSFKIGCSRVAQASLELFILRVPPHNLLPYPIHLIRNIPVEFNSKGKQKAPREKPWETWKQVVSGLCLCAAHLGPMIGHTMRGDLGGTICIKLHLGKSCQGTSPGSEDSEGQAGRQGGSNCRGGQLSIW